MLSYYPQANQPYADTDLLARWIGPGVNQLSDDHFDSKIDYLVGGGNLSLAVTGGHPSQLIEAQQKLDPRTFSGHVLRANLTYTIGRGGWTSSSHFGGNYSDGQRVEKYWFEKDRNKPETTRGWRGIAAITYPGMIDPNRENRKWGDIPSWSGSQQIALLRGAHSWKFGGNFRLGRGRAPDTTNPTVAYQTLDDLMRNAPSQVTMFTQQGNHTWSINSFGFFVQDDWRFSRKLVLNLGIRYDRFGTFVVEPRGGEPAGMFNLDGLLDSTNFVWGPLRDPRRPVEPDNLNVAPRFGFAYTADDQGNFVVRGGIGVNYSGIDAGNFENRIARRPELPERVPFSRAESAALGLKFPVYNEDMVPLVLAQRRPPQPTNRYNPDSESPYAMNYTLGIQRALTPSLVLETAYVGTRGVKFYMFRTFNKVNRVTGIRPNPNDIQGSYIDNSQQTNYNSWQTSLKQRLTNRLAFNVHHTWGKAISYTGGDTGPGYQGDAKDTVEDFNEIKIERTLSSGDINHSVSVDWVYQAPTPFANSPLARQALGGWQISGIWRARTGLPLTVSQTGGRPDIIDIKRAVNPQCCGFGNLQYLNPAAFALVAVPTASGQTIRRGYANYYALTSPGIWNLDLSLAKSFAVKEGAKLELRGDMVNALNHTQYTTIATNINGLAFGQAIGTASARVIQLQLRVGFVSILALAIDVAAQRPLNFEIGFRSGVPFTDSLSSRLTGTASAFSSATFVRPGYSVGPTFGVVLRDQTAIEFDAIYKPSRFFGSSRTGPTLQSSSTTRGSSWEFPLLVNYKFFRRPIRPFGGGGIVLGATLDGTTETRTRDLQTGVESLSTGPFRGSVENLGTALVVNGGLEWRNSRFLIRPELRYTRRPDASQNTFLFRAPNQFEYLIGFSFLGRPAR